MNLSLLFRTVTHLRPVQIVYQVRSRLVSPRLRPLRSAGGRALAMEAPVAKPASLLPDGRFEFLNLTSPFVSWDDAGRGMLWAYNLNYMDWLGQEGMTFERGAEWIERFIDVLPQNAVGQDPYPTALRGLNWVKFMSRHASRLSAEQKRRWEDSLYAQYDQLARGLEYHLLGNHLLEDAYSLYVGALYFADTRFYRKASRLLVRELDEQVLPDGAHFEQSPMYHCILLDRLLDCYNVSVANVRFPESGQVGLNDFLRAKAVRMLGHLDAMLYADGSYPLFNDSAEKIAPRPSQIFDYARRLGLVWSPVALGACGYRRLEAGRYVAMVDVGGMTASYQPGHSHADTFTYELRIDGQPFVVDTGISTYNKTARRQAERGTKAHNTVVVGEADSSRVWGGFRVASRARVRVTEERENMVAARHDGYGHAVARRFSMSPAGLEVADAYAGRDTVRSYIHFAPSVRVDYADSSVIRTSLGQVRLEGAEKVELQDDYVSTEYNVLRPTTVAVVYFRKQMKYMIS